MRPYLEQWKKDDQVPRLTKRERKRVENEHKYKPAPRELGYLIHWNDKPITTSMKNAWGQAKKRAGITRPMRPYSLRHKTVSDMLAGGADVGSVAQIVGHADPQMTLKVYQQTTSTTKQSAVNVFDTTSFVVSGESNNE